MKALIKSLGLFLFTMQLANALTWTCSSSNLNPAYLPSSCKSVIAATSAPDPNDQDYSDPNYVSEHNLWNEQACTSSGGNWVEGWYWKCDCAPATRQHPNVRGWWNPTKGCV